MRVAGLVLAAGAGRRFGGGKMLAELEGRPLLAHVLDAAHEAGLAELVVVLGADADRVRRAVDLSDARVVVNPNPARGLSSSLRLGLASLGADVDAALVLLGDQPRVDTRVVRRMASVELPPGRLFAVARHAAGGGPNPALLVRHGWPIADALEGDAGMRRVIADHPELVLEVQTPGSNPDVDTLADLAALETR